MSEVLLISGSPAASSKSAALLAQAQAYLTSAGLSADTVSVRDFSAVDLIQARYESTEFEAFRQRINAAQALIVATPVYKASYSGSLKTLLDILPQNSLRGKIILPFATGGTLAHLLALDYALKPVLAVLGASTIHQGVYAVDTQFASDRGGFRLDEELQQRLEQSLQWLVTTVKSILPEPVLQ